MANTGTGAGTTTTTTTNGGGGVAQDDFRFSWVLMFANPGILAFMGLVCAFGGVVAIQNSLNSSAVAYAWVAYGQTLQGDQVTLLPSFNFFGQIWSLLVGAATVRQQQMLTVAFFQDLFTFIISMGVVYAQNIVTRAHKGVAMTVKTAQAAHLRHFMFWGLTILVIIGNFATNALYGQGNWVGHLIIGGLVSLGTFFCPPLAILCFRAALHQRKHP